ncbi:hypothetical protein F5051DRAFT_480204 [Lentinula edodes]|nr:hypothetical protein F5051DRAFT_480204 [Lentinula edodes]
MDGQGTISPHSLLNGRENTLGGENLLGEFGKSSSRKATERQTKAALYMNHAGRTDGGHTEHRQANERGLSVTGTMERGSTEIHKKLAGGDGRHTHDSVARGVDYSGVGFGGGNVSPVGMMVEDGIPRVINANGGYFGEATAGFQESLRGFTAQEATWNTLHSCSVAGPSAGAVSDTQSCGGCCLTGMRNVTTSVSTDEVLKMLWSTYGGVETLHLNVIVQYETGGGRDVRVDWNVRVFLREGQHMESECQFLTTYTRWLLTIGVMLSIIVVERDGGGSCRRVIVINRGQ